MTTFKEGDEIEMIIDCSGNKKGERYTVKTEQSKTRELWAGKCSCNDNQHWKLIKSNSTKIMQKFKIGDKVKYVSKRHGDSLANPVWNGCAGQVAGEIINGNGTDWTIDWDNGQRNSCYKNSDLEFINQPKKSGLNNLKAAQKALRQTGPKHWFEAEATIKIKIEVAGTEADAQDEILGQYDMGGFINLTHKQLIITGIQKL